MDIKLDRLDHYTQEQLTYVVLRKPDGSLCLYDSLTFFGTAVANRVLPITLNSGLTLNSNIDYCFGDFSFKVPYSATRQCGSVTKNFGLTPTSYTASIIDISTPFANYKILTYQNDINTPPVNIQPPEQPSGLYITSTPKTDLQYGELGVYITRHYMRIDYLKTDNTQLNGRIIVRGMFV